MLTLDERFDAKVQKSDDCWTWTGATTDDGYGSFRVGEKTMRAHQFAFQREHGYLPPTVDHECHNSSDCAGGTVCTHRKCVNPLHLAAKSRGQNTRASRNTLASKQLARTHCPRNHPYDETNTYYYRGRRYCRACYRSRG